MVLDDPESIEPVSKLCPSSAVSVCATLSSLVTTAPAPPATASVAGLNAKLSILIAPVDGEPPLAVGLGVGAFAVPDPPQPSSSAAAVAATATELMTRRPCMCRPYGCRRSEQYEGASSYCSRRSAVPQPTWGRGRGIRRS